MPFGFFRKVCVSPVAFRGCNRYCTGCGAAMAEAEGGETEEHGHAPQGVSVGFGVQMKILLSKSVKLKLR